MTDQNNGLKQYSLLVVCAALTVAGYLQDPPKNNALLFWAVWALPMVPCVLLMVPFTIGRSTAAAVILAVLCIVVGIPLTIILAAVSGVGAEHVLLFGLTLTIALVGWSLLLSRGFERTGRFMAGVGAVIGLWSLLNVGLVAWQARLVAKNNAYCLAHHANATAPVKSLAELRGLSFFTTRSGYKLSSKWYFHGVLIVEEPRGQAVYNWSPRRLSFDLIERPDVMLVKVTGACQPKSRFLQDLPVL